MKLPLNVNLTGKVAVVTGAGGVICSYLSAVIAQAGAKVAVLDINQEAAQKAVDAITADGNTAMAVVCDVLNQDSIRAAHEKILAAYGKCSILINGAGGNNPMATTTSETFTPDKLGKEKTFFDLTPDGIQFALNLNFMGTVLPTQEFAKDMINGIDDTIINISSMNAFTPLTKIPAYSAAKASISNFTQWLAVYFADIGVRVNAIAPGFLSTKQTGALFYETDGITPTPRLQKIIAGTPMKKLGVPEDLAGTVLWLLCTEASSFVTGIVVPIDGGFASYSGV